MTRAPTRTHFHSARLIRVLADLALLDTVEPGTAFAEKLGMWVSFTDAITLSAVHSTSPTGMPVGDNSGVRIDLTKAFARVQNGLVTSIGQMPSELTAPDADAIADLTFAYEPYRRHYLAQQREIELRLRPLRGQVRAALGQSSARLRKLAELDAALDGILCERESKLLLKLSLLLEKRFKQLCKTQQAPDWLAGFCQDMQTVLLAELDLRMQPILGLMEACNQDTTRK